MLIWPDPNRDHSAYIERMAEIARLLRSDGHTVENHGSTLDIFRRGSKSAVVAQNRLGMQDTIAAGDIVQVSHNLGFDTRRVDGVDPDGFILINGRRWLSKSWAQCKIRTPLNLDAFGVSIDTIWIGVSDEQGVIFEELPYDRRCILALKRRSKETAQTLTLRAYDGWGDRGGPGNLLRDIGVFTVSMIGTDLLIEPGIESSR